MILGSGNKRQVNANMNRDYEDQFNLDEVIDEIGVSDLLDGSDKSRSGKHL